MCVWVITIIQMLPSFSQYCSLPFCALMLIAHAPTIAVHRLTCPFIHNTCIHTNIKHYTLHD